MLKVPPRLHSPHLPTNPLDSHFRFRCCDGENLKYDSRLDNYQRKQRVMLDLFISVRKMVLKTFTIVHHYDANTNIVSSYGLISKIGAALSFKGGKLILSRSSSEHFASEKSSGFSRLSSSHFHAHL